MSNCLGDPFVYKRHKKQYILIYDDKGSSKQSIQAIYIQILNSRDLSPYYKIKTVDGEYIRTKSWEENTVLFIMGGGVCSEWDESLGSTGIVKIRMYVVNNGRFLGICAGAYFASAHSFFTLGGKSPIEKERDLCFYSGSAIGPILDTSDHLSLDSLIAVQIDMAFENEIKTGNVYYQGGCRFNINECTGSTKVLAKYVHPYTGAAIISCIAGHGKAVLCGVHPEFAWDRKLADKVQSDQYATTVNILTEEEQFRRNVWAGIINELFIDIF